MLKNMADEMLVKLMTVVISYLLFLVPAAWASQPKPGWSLEEGFVPTRDLTLWPLAPPIFSLHTNELG